MPKFSPYPRREYDRLFRAWARRNTRLLSIVALGVLVLVAFESAIAVFLVPERALRWWLLGVLQTLAVGAGLHLVNSSFIAHEREAIWQLRGAWGEDATRDQLRRAKRKHLIWGWVDSVGLRSGDLDHVVVTRNGGMLVIDSKWRSDERLRCHRGVSRTGATPC